MVAAINWESSPSLTSHLTTELNSLANDGSVLGAAIDNSSGLDMFMDIEFYVNTQGSARTSGAHIAIYLIPAPDGTNYHDHSQLPINRLIATLPLDAATTARRIGGSVLAVPPGLFKLLFVNKTGQALAATSNTAGYRLYSVESQ